MVPAQLGGRQKPGGPLTKRLIERGLPGTGTQIPVPLAPRRLRIDRHLVQRREPPKRVAAEDDRPVSSVVRRIVERALADQERRRG